jgi:sporulation protein YlmC with PRC-barrel domain
MLRPVKNILNYKILATDGEIGGVSDLIVDDQKMKLRYLVIDTGNWLPGRRSCSPPRGSAASPPRRRRWW